MGLLGTTAPHIENLSFLATFDIIRNNSFHGHLPGKLGQLSRLRILLCKDNNFTGMVPSRLGGIYTMDRVTITWKITSCLVPIPSTINFQQYVSNAMASSSKLVNVQQSIQRRELHYA
jgi:hypothetical protein